MQENQRYTNLNACAKIEGRKSLDCQLCVKYRQNISKGVKIKWRKV